MSDLIKATDINVSRQGKKILDDVSVSLGHHDFLTIIGPNGAGKSMLLKCLMGFYLPDAGTVKRATGLRVGYVPQHFAPEHTMPISVKRFLGLRRNVDKKQLDKVTEETSVISLLEKPLFTLSGGERQRVLLARSLLIIPIFWCLMNLLRTWMFRGNLVFTDWLRKFTKNVKSVY